jgi:hypothetical protein
MTVAEVRKSDQKAPAGTLESKLVQKLGSYVALTTALIAALAAITSLLMAKHGGRATSQLIAASDCWSHYQSKSLKSYILTTESTLLEAMGKTPGEKEKAKLAELEKEKTQIASEAAEATASSKFNGKLSMFLSMAVMMFQIAIANCAISALAKKPAFWLIGIALALLGLCFFGYYGAIVSGICA